MRTRESVLGLIIALGLSASADRPQDVGSEELAARTDPQQDAQKYRPPGEFNGHSWNTPIVEFERLATDPLSVQIAQSRGKVTEVDFRCIPRGLNPCDLAASLEHLYQRVEGEGFHALAEYYIESQGFRVQGSEGEGAAVLFPVLYQFCANWGGFTSDVPDDILERMKLCGVRMYFKSETPEELRSITDDDYVTNYDRVLHWLIRTHGEPEGYRKRGRVIIETPNERIAEPRKRRFDEWRWCRLCGRDIAPDCEASVVFTFDTESGVGLVLYVTRPVWEFAYARHHGGAKDDPLYKLLHGMHKYHPVDHQCVGSHLCRPGPPRKMSEEKRARFRLPDTAQ